MSHNSRSQNARTPMKNFQRPENTHTMLLTHEKKYTC